MLKTVIAAFVLFTLSAPAQVNQRVGNKIAYYGDDFYNNGIINKDTLFKILNSTHAIKKGQMDSIGGSCGNNCYRQTSVGYDGARKYLFGEIYILRDSEGTYVSDVYCGKKFHFRSVNDASDMHTEVNIEHTWPQSKFSSKFERGMQKSDMHHLFLTDSVANSNRGNFEFGDVTTARNELSARNCPNSRLGRVDGDMLYMPPSPHRGNTARALFYFAVRYQMSISAEQEKVLRQWHKSDPVDEQERARHEKIAELQNVRNPFIDYPELADKISNF